MRFYRTRSERVFSKFRKCRLPNRPSRISATFVAGNSPPDNFRIGLATFCNKFDGSLAARPPSPLFPMRGFNRHWQLTRLAVNPLGGFPAWRLTAWRYPRMAVNLHGGQSPINLLLVTSLTLCVCVCVCVCQCV